MEVHDWERVEYGPSSRDFSGVREGPRWRCSKCGGASYRQIPLGTDLVVLDGPYQRAGGMSCEEAVMQEVMGS